MDYLVPGEELYGELGACGHQNVCMGMAFSERASHHSCVCVIREHWQEDEHPRANGVAASKV